MLEKKVNLKDSSERLTFRVLLRVLIRCIFSLSVWFLQRFTKEARNSHFEDGFRSPVGDKLALFKCKYNISISSSVPSCPSRTIKTIIHFMFNLSNQTSKTFVLIDRPITNNSNCCFIVCFN